MANKSKPLGRRAGTVLFVLLLVVLSYRFLAVGTPARSEEPSLEIDPKSLSFGPVQFVAKYAHTISLRNLTDHDVEVTEFLTSCSCVEVSPPSVTIPANGKASVVMTLDMKRFVTPGSEPAIEGEVEFTPVVSGRAMLKSLLAFELIRPKVLSLSPEIDFGTIYDVTSDSVPNGVLFVADDFDINDIALETAAPFVHHLSLTRLDDRGKSYKRFAIVAEFSPEHGSPGINTFQLIATHTSGHTVTIPCRVRLDSGLRLHVADPPPRLVSLDTPVIWHVDAYQLDGSLTDVLAETDDQTHDSTQTISKEPMDDGSWRLVCRLIPHVKGNVKFHLRVSGKLVTGRRTLVDREFHFYVPYTSEGD